MVTAGIFLVQLRTWPDDTRGMSWNPAPCTRTADTDHAFPRSSSFLVCLFFLGMDPGSVLSLRAVLQTGPVLCSGSSPAAFLHPPSPVALPSSPPCSLPHAPLCVCPYHRPYLSPSPHAFRGSAELRGHPPLLTRWPVLVLLEEGHL